MLSFSDKSILLLCFGSNSRKHLRQMRLWLRWSEFRSTVMACLRPSLQMKLHPSQTVPCSIFPQPYSIPPTRPLVHDPHVPSMAFFFSHFCTSSLVFQGGDHVVALPLNWSFMENWRMLPCSALLVRHLEPAFFIFFYKDLFLDNTKIEIWQNQWESSWKWKRKLWSHTLSCIGLLKYGNMYLVCFLVVALNIFVNGTGFSSRTFVHPSC